MKSIDLRILFIRIMNLLIVIISLLDWIIDNNLYLIKKAKLKKKNIRLNKIKIILNDERR